MVADHYGIDSVESILKEYLGQWTRIAAAGIDLLPGADAAVRSAAAAGIKVALVTSGERHYADGFLKLTGLADVFSASVAQEDVSHVKPHPEPYLKAAELLSVNPSKCTVFEDSIPGFVAARAAGMTCVGVGKVALAVESDQAPDMAITTFEGFDIWNVRPV